MIKISNLYKQYGDRIIFKDLNLEIDSGEFLSISGKSGIGKSTLLNIISLLEMPDGGEYYFNNALIDWKDKIRHAEIRNRNMGFIFQSYNLLNRLTARENIFLPLLYSKRKEEIDINSIAQKLDIVNILDDQIDYLSGGEKQRVATARALITNPELILCDEPTGNLDEENSLFLMNILNNLNKEGKTILFVTHEKKYDRFFNRKIELHEGKYFEL